MPHRIIAVFQDAALLRSHREVLERASFDVCPAPTFMELRRHMEEGKCEIVIIGPTIAAAEKLRIGEYVQRLDPACRLVEIYEFPPQLKIAHAQVPSEGGIAALLHVINEKQAAASSQTRIERERKTIRWAPPLRPKENTP